MCRVVRAGRLSADFLEAGENDSEGEGGDGEGNLGRIKAAFKAGGALPPSRKRVSNALNTTHLRMISLILIYLLLLRAEI